VLRNKKVLAVIFGVIGLIGLQSMLYGLLGLFDVSFTFKGSSKADYYFWRFVFGSICASASLYMFKNKILNDV